jgi:hypothetical protein
MLFENLVNSNRAAFLAKVTDISLKLGIVPDWLMAVMQSESNIDERAINPTSGATGLIQFMPATAAGLGTSVSALRQMTNIQQLEYVYKYFKPYSGRLKSVTDLYAVVFFPVALGKPDNFILETRTIKADTIARQNPIFDLDKNKVITYGEFKAAVLKRIPSETAALIKKKRL